MRVLLRGLALVLPVVLTIYVLCWVGAKAESVLGDLIPQAYYEPGMGIAAGLVLVFAVGILTSFWLFDWLFAWAERQISRIPLVGTLYASIKDLAGFLPGGRKGPGFKEVVVANIAGSRLIGMVTREDFSDLPKALHGKDEVLVYFPMSYQLGGFTVWVPRSAVTTVDLTVAEGMRFAMTGGMSTKPAGVQLEKKTDTGTPSDASGPDKKS